jgi:hypothetical protein
MQGPVTFLYRIGVYRTLQVVFDTGSSTLEFASTLCAACSNQVQFNPNASSTFQDGGRTSSITFSTGVGVDPVVGANYRLTLRSGTDTVSAGGLTVPNTDLFLVTDQTEKFDIDPFSGIQGVPQYGKYRWILIKLLPKGLSARAQGFFAGLVAQGLPCACPCLTIYFNLV